MKSSRSASVNVGGVLFVILFVLLGLPTMLISYAASMIWIGAQLGYLWAIEHAMGLKPKDP